ncbi:hypothetical protein KJ359_012373 [Pestalotiopsis sp. 9143b]|nr:hypothetical protein KJ359_012373 [Pestalotiopsis sp. 9143b]
MWSLVGYKATVLLFVASIGVTVLLVTRLTYSPAPTVLPFTTPYQPNLTYPESSDFPKKIWQSWKDDSENPTIRTKGVPRQWRLLNPDHRYERLTDNNVDTYVQDNFNRDISELFSNLTDPILRADFLRYLIMLREGGLWADIDVLPRQPISEWVREEQRPFVNMVIGIENDHEKRPIWEGIPYSVQLAQYTMLANPGHPIFATLVDEVSNNLRRLMRSKVSYQYLDFEDVMTATGPFAFTKAVMDYLTEITGVRHNGNELTRLRKPKLIGDVLILPRDYFGWTLDTHTLMKADPRVLVVHIFMGSWRNDHSG